MGSMSRRKGAVGEREVAALIRDASGGVFDAQRGCQHAGRFAVGVASPDVLTSFPMHIEVKRTEKFSLRASWTQAMQDAGIDKEPCVATRWNAGEWLAVCRASYLVAVLAELERLRAENLQQEKEIEELSDSPA